MKYPSEVHEDTERKLLRECTHTRNKHIEIEERYKRLVSRKSSKIDLAALESVLRKKEETPKEEAPNVSEPAAEEAEQEPVEEKTAQPPVEETDQDKDQENVEISPEEPAVEPEIEPLDESREVSFEEILKLQASMMARMAELRSPDFYKHFFGDEHIAEMVLDKDETEAEPENTSEDRIESVEVEEIILPEDDEGLGLVFATPVENKEARDAVTETGHNMKKSAVAIALAAAVLVGGVLLVCSMWPVGG